MIKVEFPNMPIIILLHAESEEDFQSMYVAWDASV